MIKKRKVAIIGIICAFLVTLPLLPIVINSNCFLISSISQGYLDDDATLYLPKASTFAKGYWWIGHEGYYEYRNDYFSTSEKLTPIVSGLFQLLIQNMSQTYVVISLVFISLIFITGFNYLADLIKHDAYVVLILVILIFIPEIFGILNSPINNYLIPLGRYVRRFYHILLTLPLLFIYLKLLYEFFINQHLNKKKFLRLSV